MHPTGWRCGESSPPRRQRHLNARLGTTGESHNYFFALPTGYRTGECSAPLRRRHLNARLGTTGESHNFFAHPTLWRSGESSSPQKFGEEFIYNKFLGWRSENLLEKYLWSETWYRSSFTMISVRFYLHKLFC